MILLDSLYINNGGGKILLNYLVQELEKQKFDEVFYLFDERCKDDFDSIASSRKIYLKASLIERHLFYKRNRYKFRSVFCFGNLAPTIKLNIPVYTYFHQTMYLNIPEEFSAKQQFLFRIKIFIFSKLLKNTNFLAVQNNFMKKELNKKFKFSLDNILLLPFYNNEKFFNKELEREKNSYIYVSSGVPHKNHIRLINAFCKYYDITNKGKLYLTVNPKEFENLNLLIDKKKQMGYPIINLDFIDRDSLINYYNKIEYLIFPSLEESFGLGLIEAIDCGCKIIGSDLPYIYEVCEPSIVFDPLREESIVEAFIKSSENDIKESKKSIKNKISELINLLLNHG